jgi:hypothetical protein
MNNIKKLNMIKVEYTSFSFENNSFLRATSPLCFLLHILKCLDK